MDYQLTCPVCEATYAKQIKFCTECGCNLSHLESVTITQPVREEKLVDNLRSQVQSLGQKAQKSLSGASSIILDRASNVSKGTDNMVVQQKVTEAMASLVNMMINVSSDVKHGISADMVDAVDLSARVNFVAFSIGVTIDLATLKAKSKEATSLKQL